MKTIIYLADTHLSSDSYRVIGIADNKEKAIKLLTPYLNKYACENWENEEYNGADHLLHDLLNSLITTNQTQNMDINYIIKDIQLNKISNH